MDSETPQPSTTLSTVMWTGAPLAVVWVWVTGIDESAPAKVSVALLLAMIASLGVLAWRLGISDSSGSSTAARRFAQLIAARDFPAAATLGKDSGLLNSDQARAIGALHQDLTTLQKVSAEQRRYFEEMGVLTTTLNDSVAQQLSTLEQLSRGSGNGERSTIVKENIESLARSAEESSSSVLEMVAINNEVRENIHNLAMSVQETTSAIEEMAFSSKEVAKNIEELSTAAEETAASMNQMDVSISQVETNANETSKLSETVTQDAETGVAAINHTIKGIDKIKESSRVAADVITNLGQKINEIGNILNVIDDVAEQTNLLALNAAIIAAQAGEHGRGFAVVADEIKALAERTGASTKEIAGLIKNIQDESRNAVSVMSRGVEDVEEGVRLGHNAEDALRKIVESAKRSTLMIQAIAQATVEQAKGSKQVTNAISRIAETVQQIAFASAEQARGSEHIMQSAERMKIITQQVERSADEQNRGGRQVTQSIESIREYTERINGAFDDRSGQEAATSTAEARDASERALQASQALEGLLVRAVGALESGEPPKPN